jgi:hypothetical protein
VDKNHRDIKTRLNGQSTEERCTVCGYLSGLGSTWGKPTRWILPELDGARRGGHLHGGNVLVANSAGRRKWKDT